nr:uncharacterized protein LOC109155304 [Ipomoea batatas]
MLIGTGEQVDDNQLYYDVVGGHDKKRRIYGLGSYGCSIVNGSTSDNTSGNMTPTSRPPDNATPASVQDEIQSLKATILLMQQRLDAIDGGRAGQNLIGNFEFVVVLQKRGDHVGVAAKKREMAKPNLPWNGLEFAAAAMR